MRLMQQTDTDAPVTPGQTTPRQDVSPEAPVKATRLPYGLRSLGHRDYRIFFTTQLFSLTGTWMQTLAQSWLVLSLTNSPAALGLVGVFQFGPTLLLGLPAGVFVDRVPKRYLLICTQICFAIITAMIQKNGQTRQRLCRRRSRSCCKVHAAPKATRETRETRAIVVRMDQKAIRVLRGRLRCRFN